MDKRTACVRSGLLRTSLSLAAVIVAVLPVGCGGDDFTQSDGPGQDAGDASSDSSGGSGGAKPDSGGDSAKPDADAGCGAGTKACGGKCVTLDDPAYGCVATSCDPCEIPNASAKCSAAGACELDACAQDFEDCDKDPSNGCEGNLLNDPKNCAACGTVCPSETGTPVCKTGVCGLSSCAPGKGDCDSDPQTCETDITTVDNCGFCINQCNLPFASEKCEAGACAVDQCDDHRGNCDGIASNGCEIDLSVTTAHCGECDKTCTVGDGGAATCVDSKCGVDCADGLGDCNEELSDGCEVDLTTTLSHCGACDSPCVLPNAVNGCVDSKCVIESCNTGWGDCDSVLPGCETDLNTTPAHCSACNAACPARPHAVSTCTAGVCGYTCEGSWTDCDGVADNGCEFDIASDPEHCGGCDTQCVTPFATPACNSGVCAVKACDPARLDCNGTVADGCEEDSLASHDHCGSCNHACALTNATGTCNGGICGFVCDAPWADCDSPAVDACTVDTATSMDHCGGCNQKCALSNASETCAGGACKIVACEGAYLDCNGEASDGCESNPATDANNCGGCGNICLLPHAGASCMAAVCVVASCEGAWRNCNGLPGDGCETDTATDLQHCGGCTDSVCAFDNAGESCDGGVCTMGACDATWSNCDGEPANGCEKQLTTDGKNCGVCGHDCLGGTCLAGKCQPFTIALGEPKPWSIAVDSTHVYWSNYTSTGAIRRATITGGAAENLATSQNLPNGIAVNSTRIYWAAEGESRVRMTLKGGGGAVTTIWNLPASSPAAVSATDAVVVWDTWAGGIYRANADGSSPAVVYPIGTNSNPNRIVTDGTYIWWVNWGGGQVRRGTLTSGVPINLATSQGELLSVAVDDTHAYWTSGNPSNLIRRGLKGETSTPVTLASEQTSTPIGLAVDATHVYFASADAGTVSRVAKSGSPATVELLATGQGYPAFMAVDATAIYWANRDGGQIMRLAKP